MGQVTIYLDAEAERQARSAARAEGISLSKWVTRRIHKSTKSEWPEGVRRLAGAWPDVPSAREIRRSKARDTRRERL